MFINDNEDFKRDQHDGNDSALKALPGEFRELVRRESSRSKHTIEFALLTWATLFFAAGCFSPFFLKPFLGSSWSFRARTSESSEALGFVTYLDSLEENSGSKMKEIFGWGGLEVVSRASQALAPHLQPCRAQLQEAARAHLTIRFDVKVDVTKPGFRVNGLLEGVEREPAVVTCLRDKIDGLAIPDFGSLRSVAPKSYKLRLGVQLAHGADGGAP